MSRISDPGNLSIICRFLTVLPRHGQEIAVLIGTCRSAMSSHAAHRRTGQQQPNSSAASTAGRDRERDRSPTPMRREGDAAWATLADLTRAGTNATAVMAVESWCFEHNLDAHITGFTVGSRGSRLARLRGDCYICRRPHKSNHWVIVESPGYTTSRIVCHSTGRNATGPHFGL